MRKIFIVEARDLKEITALSLEALIKLQAIHDAHVDEVRFEKRRFIDEENTAREITALVKIPRERVGEPG